MEGSSRWGEMKRAFPGWLFLLLLVVFFPAVIVVESLFSLGMDFVPLVASVFLAALFVWVIIKPPPPKPQNEDTQRLDDGAEQQLRLVWHGRAKVAGLVGGILFSIVGYYAATKAHADPQRLADRLDQANYRVFVAFMICGWLPYLILRFRSWWGRRK